MVEEGGSWWFQGFNGEREFIGQTPEEVLLFLLRNQDHCVEVVCRLQVKYDGEELMKPLAGNRQQGRSKTPFWDERTIKAVEDWLRWLDQQIPSQQNDGASPSEGGGLAMPTRNAGGNSADLGKASRACR